MQLVHLSISLCGVMHTHIHNQTSCGSCDNVWDDYYRLRADNGPLQAQRHTVSSTLLSK